jgi:ribosomal protein L11 methyltransferase
MKWLQVHFKIDRNQSNTLEDILSEIGASSITLKNTSNIPHYEILPGEEPSWPSVTLSALFNVIDSPEPLINSLNHHLPKPLPSFEIEPLEQEDWDTAWMKFFKPIQMSDRFWICPSWEQPPEPNAINLIIEPGLAFGTGTHPTTYLCLQWLDQHCDINAQHIVDYGCGSGILSIAAALLSQARITAIDHDPQALIATKNNIKNNNIPLSQVDIFPPDKVSTTCKGDVILANILAQPLITLKETFITLCTPETILVLSGILAEQTDLIVNHYQVDFTILNISERDGWVRIDLRKK